MAYDEPLRDTIDAAFRDMPRPEKDTLIVCGMRGDLERENLYWKISDLRWEGVPANLSLFVGGPINFLSAEGLHYFLPGFMIAGIERYDYFFDFVVNSLIFSLHPLAEDERRDDEEYRRHRREKFDHFESLMTRSQRAALCSFLQYLIEQDPREFKGDPFFMETMEYWCENR